MVEDLIASRLRWKRFARRLLKSLRIANAMIDQNMFRMCRGRSRRELRGFEIVREQGSDIRFLGGDRYTVPSASPGGNKYIVNLATDDCECPDAGKGNLCKHVFAVRYYQRFTTHWDLDNDPSGGDPDA